MIESVKKERPKDISRACPDLSGACRVMATSRSSMGYTSVKDDSLLVEQLGQLAAGHPREGFWKYYFRIRNQGQIINHKRLHRVYKKIGLNLRRKCKKRIPARIKEPLVLPPVFTQAWSMDFMRDALLGGQKFRSL